MVVSECSEEDERASCLMRTSERHVDTVRYIYGECIAVQTHTQALGAWIEQS